MGLQNLKKLEEGSGKPFVWEGRAPGPLEADHMEKTA